MSAFADVKLQGTWVASHVTLGFVSSYVLRDDIELQNNTQVVLLTVFIFGSLTTNLYIL